MTNSVWQEELERLIGMKNIKEEITKIKNNFEDMHEQEKKGLRDEDAQSPAYHLAFLGNPGTGKTTIAKIMGEIFRDIGVLKSGKVIEANYSDLVSQHIGETAQKTTALLNKARDGVLFIDEAYMLLKEGSSSFGEEAIDTITKRMEDERDQLVVIVAGYPNEMRDFFKKANSGFVGRFPKKNHIKFPDYQPSELLELFDLLMKEEGADIESTPEFREDIEEIIINMYNERDVSTFSNARAMRDFAQNVFAMRATRRNGNHLPVDTPIESTDISSEYTQFLTPPTPDEQKLMAKLNELVGLDDVKEHVESLRRRLKNKLLREKLGQKDSGWTYPHLVFTGNPGTGKTTVAEIMGEIFSTTGIIRKKDVLPVRAGDLIAGYVGQTAERTREKLEEALDGVVLIDEAYELTSRGDQGSSYKEEAIGALMKFVDEYTPNKRIVVILAGYPEKMAEFIDSNSGLQSRFPNIIHFPDYSTDELIEILCLKAKKMNIELPQKTIEKARIFIDRSRDLEREKFGNARIIDGLIEIMKKNQNQRFFNQNEDEKVLKIFLPEDVPDLSGK